MTNSNTFGGFEPPMSNFFKMPNTWTDITAEINNLAELKVVEYVMRHTWGFQEFGIKKTISTDEFMYGRKYKDAEGNARRMDKGTGLKSDRSVRDGIDLAIEHGYLVCEVDYSDKARVKKSYALKMQDTDSKSTLVVSTTPVQSTTLVDTTDLDPHIHQSGPTNLPIRPTKSTSRSEKETLERHSRKTPKKESMPPTITNVEKVDSSFQSLDLSPDESFLLNWIDEKGIIKAQNEAVVNKLVKKLASRVKTQDKQELQKLFEIAKARTPGDGVVRLGNLVKDYVINEWLQWMESQAQAKPLIMPPEIKNQAGMTRETVDLLVSEIKGYNGAIITTVDEVNRVLFVSIAIENDKWLRIESPDDWYYMEQEKVDQAIQHGESLAKERAA